MSKRSKLFWLILGFVLTAFIATVNYLTDLDFLVFILFILHILLISLVTLFVGRWSGFLVSMIIIGLCLIENLITSTAAPAFPFVFYWGAIQHLGLFLPIVLGLPLIKEDFVREKELARTANVKIYGPVIVSLFMGISGILLLPMFLIFNELFGLGFDLFLVGLISCLSAFLAIVFGINTYITISKNPTTLRGRWLAMVSIVLGVLPILQVVLSMLGLILGITGLPIG